MLQDLAANRLHEVRLGFVSANESACAILNVRAQLGQVALQQRLKCAAVAACGGFGEGLDRSVVHALPLYVVRVRGACESAQGDAERPGPGGRQRTVPNRVSLFAVAALGGAWGSAHRKSTQSALEKFEVDMPPMESRYQYCQKRRSPASTGANEPPATGVCVRFGW